MSCPHCAGATQKALEAIDGISHVLIDLEKGEATFEGQAELQKVKNAIAGIGFEVIS